MCEGESSSLTFHILIKCFHPHTAVSFPKLWPKIVSLHTIHIDEFHPNTITRSLLCEGIISSGYKLHAPSGLQVIVIKCEK